MNQAFPYTAFGSETQSYSPKLIATMTLSHHILQACNIAHLRVILLVGISAATLGLLMSAFLQIYHGVFVARIYPGRSHLCLTADVLCVADTLHLQLFKEGPRGLQSKASLSLDNFRAIETGKRRGDGGMGSICWKGWTLNVGFNFELWINSELSMVANALSDFGHVHRINGSSCTNFAILWKNSNFDWFGGVCWDNNRLSYK